MTNVSSVQSATLTDKQLASLLNKLRKVKSWSIHRLALKAFGDDLAAYRKLFDAIRTGRLAAAPTDPFPLRQALARLCLEVAHSANATPTEVIDYLTTLDEVLFHPNQEWSWSGVQFLQGADTEILPYVVKDADAFEAAIPRFPPFYQHGVTLTLWLLGRRPPLRDGFVDWLAQQFRNNFFPQFTVTSADGWAAPRPSIVSTFHVRTFDYETRQWTEDGKKMIELFVPFDVFLAARAKKSSS